MNNVSVTISSEAQTLEAGAAISATATTLYQGPARLSAATSTLDRAAALEGQIDAILHVHTAEDLLKAAQVLVGTAEYRVVSAEQSGPNWRLRLSRREHHAD